MVIQPPKAQRIGVFVDVQNMYYSARFTYNAKVNFKNILQDAIKNRVFVRGVAYVIRTEDIRKEAFFESLQHMGFEVRAKDLQVFAGGAKKGDWDVGIAMDMIEMAPRLDTLVLVSGDGDFIPLVEHLKRAMGCRVEVMAFGKSASGKLIEAADSFIDLDKNTRKYLLSSDKRRASFSRTRPKTGPKAENKAETKTENKTETGGKSNVRAQPPKLRR